MTIDAQDTLEQCLATVAHDTDGRYGFYNQFSNAELYGLLVSELPQGKSVIKKDTPIQLQELTFEGKSYVPVFSSLAKLQAFMQKECNYIGVKGRDLVSIVHERELFLNPGSHYSKIVTRKEMKYMNSGAPTSVEEPTKPTLLKRLLGKRNA